jgi:signal transduction histidine kinase
LFLACHTLGGFRMTRNIPIEHAGLKAKDAEARDERAQTRKLARYFLAAGFVALAFGIRYWLRPELGDELPFMFFIAASLVAAWCGGATAGIVALIVGLILGDRFFLHDNAAHPSPDSIQVARITRYILTAAIGVALIEVLHRGKKRTEELVTDLRSEVIRRKNSEGQLLEAKNQLADRALELEHRVAERTAHLQTTVTSLESVLYEMAHNLRAPLRAMEGYATVLNQEHAEKLNATGKELCHRISDAGSRMDVLIIDLLSYGRLGHVEVELAPVALRECINGVLLHLSDQIKLKRAEVTVEVSPLEIRAESQLLVQVLYNLLDNALKFVTPNVAPRIRIYSELRETVVRLWIEDNGIGIDPHYHLRVFRPFERLDQGNASRGTGMGLAVVAKAVERMGGTVGVDSKPGVGSRFWLALQRPSQSSNAPAELARAILLKG